MIIQKFNDLTGQLLHELHACYGPRLVSVVLFGSVARNTPSYDSDVDILIIANDLPEGRMRRVREFDDVEERLSSAIQSLQEYNIHTIFSPIFKTPDEALRGSPLFIDMVDDAQILFDPSGFFKKIISGLKAKLAERGARRIWNGNAWYWDLKPDYRPGEVFDI